MNDSEILEKHAHRTDRLTDPRVWGHGHEHGIGRWSGIVGADPPIWKRETFASVDEIGVHTHEETMVAMPNGNIEASPATSLPLRAVPA